MRDTVLPSHTNLPLPGAMKTRHYLEEFGFKRRRWPRRGYIWLVIALALAVALGIAIPRWIAPTLIPTDVVLAATALGALVVGFQQWQEARHEISMDKYYDRLDIANKRRENGDGSGYEMMRVKWPEFGEPNVNRMMLVYAELDNLEYVAEKYRLGYMTARQACRGLRTFQGRCLSADFRSLARERVHLGDYNRGTGKIVDIVCDKVEARVRKQQVAHTIVPEKSIVTTEPIVEEKVKATLVRRLELAAGIVFPAVVGILMIRHRI